MASSHAASLGAREADEATTSGGSDDDATPITVLVLGRSGLTGDVVRHRLRTSEVEVGALGTDAAAPDVVILADPSEADWVQATDLGAGIVVVTDAADGDTVVELLIRGAGAVVSSASSPDALPRAVEVVAAGGTLIDPDAASIALRHLREHGPKTLVKTLTRRECQILASIERGESVKQTARGLGISTKTVQNLQIGLYNKLRARNRAQAVARAIEIGLL
jgi:DNA-binding NarL/FixJ family response regulator